ncbi:uncharacterized protein A4U43_C01F14760 [Asparagus officinalis]|uniref:Uncharacterized protein n=1 Tax=Asparagus officinalis TaxID=4686 RepID=A0A5P1FPL8_ASPOF|nr:uncharacterized protein A4U43_C01F14760 [Asparagus officinalis]
MKIGRHRLDILFLEGQLVFISKKRLNLRFTEEHLAKLGEIGEEESLDGAAPTSLPTSGEFEPVDDFDGASGVLESDPTIDMTISFAPAPILAAQCRLVVPRFSDEDDDISPSNSSRSYHVMSLIFTMT